ncbi:MAG: hypothetical protein RL732_1556 [Bacteroidota bacterium]
MAIKKQASKPAKKAAPANKKPAAKKPVAKTVVKKVAPKKAAPKKAAPAKPKPAAKKTAVKNTVKKVVAKKPSTPAKPEVKKKVATKTEPEKKIKLVSAPPPPVRKKPEPAKPVKVVIPAIKAKTSVAYKPEFTKSVLDASQSIQTGPTMRYSDGDLAEFREIIQKKLDQAKKELAFFQGMITRKDEMGGDETENRYITMEDGSVSMEREQLAQMVSRTISYIDHLQKALMRIENKTYGICRVTGKLIDKARLRAVPHATLSIEAKEKMNR